MLRTILALLQIKGIGDAFIKKNLTYLSQSGLSYNELCNLDKRITPNELSQNYLYAEKIIQRCKELDISICHIGESNYPKKLKEINSAPSVLYMRGNTSLLSSDIVSIIGTRQATGMGEAIAHKIGSYMSAHCSICNGLVEGIDKAAISDNDIVFSNVIGVISGGLDYVNTSSKITSRLADIVLQNNGLLLSEFEPDKKEDAFSGSKASRIQAGIADALILVQSSIDGGSKYTLETFSRLNRVLGVVNYPESNEFCSHDSFSANRLIIEKKARGLADMCKIKDVGKIVLREIVEVRNSDDYIKIINQLCRNISSNLFE